MWLSWDSNLWQLDLQSDITDYTTEPRRRPTRNDKQLADENYDISMMIIYQKSTNVIIYKTGTVLLKWKLGQQATKKNWDVKLKKKTNALDVLINKEIPKFFH